MKNKLNILIVHNHYQNRGGEDTVVENEMNMLKENGYNVILYEKNNNEIKHYNFFQKIKLAFMTIYNFKTAKEIKNIIKMNKIDIVHVHNTLPLISDSVYYAALKMNVPVIQTIHNFRFICPNALLYRDNHICEECLDKGLGCAIKHKCYRNNKLQTLLCVIKMKIHRLTGIYKKINFICLTDFNKQKLLTLPQINSDKVFVKPNFVTTYKRENNSCIERENQFLYVGRLDETKGIKVLFEAWKKVDANIKLFVYGDGPLYDWCNNFIEENKMKNIYMEGFQDKSIIQEKIQCSKALIFPSVLYEQFAITIIESLSNNTPVITYDIVNQTNLINEKNGFKYKNPNDLIEIVNNFEFKYNDIQLDNKYCKEYNFKILEEIYTKILKKNNN